uniref:TIL domain-containing protein n=1 Tax=Onchocerca volvulus TaxID=6282 RepID=A0A8R1TM75_ONCVO
MNPFFIFITAFVVIFTSVEGMYGCRKNEIWMECGGYELRCGQKYYSYCFLECNPPGCYCAASYGFRLNYKGNCIPKHRCSRFLDAPRDFILKHSVTHWNSSEES